MKRYYFTRLESEIVMAETEAEARSELERWTGASTGFQLESVEDA